MAAPELPRTVRVRALRVPDAPNRIILLVSGAITRACIPALCDRVRGMLEHDAKEIVVCDVGALTDTDAATVDALARLQVTARRLGSEVRVRRASRDLQDLIAFMGLGSVVPLCSGSVLEAGWKAEQREEPGRVEKERDPGDAVP